MAHTISIYMLGTGSPRPDLERYSVSQALVVDDVPIMIDCGENATQQLLKVGIAPQNVRYLWFTHLHSDHVFGYPRFLLGGWGMRRDQLTVIGPSGTKRFHDTLIDMFEDDIAYRRSVGYPPEGILDVNVIEIEEPGVVQLDFPWKVTTEKMIHNVPTYAFRFDIGSKAVVFSGDTAPTEALVRLAQGADVLVHDAGLATNPRYENPTDERVKTIWANLQKEHCTPRQAAETARRAGVKTLVLTHFLPQVNESKILKEASEVFDGTIIVAKDLQKIDVV